MTQLTVMLGALLPLPTVELGGKEGDGPSMGIGSEVLETIFIQCIVWSIGAGLLEEGRVKFDTYLKKLAALTQNAGEGACAKQGEIPVNLPTLYEYMFDQQKLLWVPWANKVPDYIHKPGMKFNEILVPTVDTVRNTWLLQLMVRVRRPVVLVGETGTSKTATTQNFLRELDPESYVRLLINIMQHTYTHVKESLNIHLFVLVQY